MRERKLTDSLAAIVLTVQTAVIRYLIQQAIAEKVGSGVWVSKLALLPDPATSAFVFGVTHVPPFS
jgi:hypothetical protein